MQALLPAGLLINNQRSCIGNVAVVHRVHVRVLVLQSLVEELEAAPEAGWKHDPCLGSQTGSQLEWASCMAAASTRTAGVAGRAAMPLPIGVESVLALGKHRTMKRKGGWVPNTRTAVA